MTNPEYVIDPHLDIQRALRAAEQAGATQATIRFSTQKRTATLEDNRPPNNQHIQTFNINVHPASGFQWTPHQAMRLHTAPKGLRTTLVNQYREDTEPATQEIRSLHQDSLGERTTQDGKYSVYITPDEHSLLLTVSEPDGTSSTHQVNNPTMGYYHTTSREPGHQVIPQQYSTIAVALEPDLPLPPSTGQLQEFLDISTLIAAQHILNNPCRRQGYAWPNQALRQRYQDLQQLDPGLPGLPQAPSTSEYQATDPDTGLRGMTSRLTPTNAVLCDYDSIQEETLDYAMRKFTPRQVTPVRTKDPDVPAIRLIKAQVQNDDDTVTHYPVNIWNMEYQSGRYNGSPVPTGERLPHSRVGRVKKILLTMEINHGQKAPSDIFTFETDVYADEDRHHHLLLLTHDSTVTPLELANIAFLHNPHTEHLPLETQEAVHSDPHEWYTQLLVDQVLLGPSQAAENLLRQTAAALEALGAHDQQTGTSDTITATSPSGQVSITLNPTPTPGGQQ